MNKIYRRLWSTARQCWVVASELTAPRSKASQVVRAGLVVSALVVGAPAALASDIANEQEEEQLQSLQAWARNVVLGAGATAPEPAAGSFSGILSTTLVRQLALTTDSLYRDSSVDGNNLVLLGSRSRLVGDQSVGYGNLINARGNNNTAIGYGVEVVNGGYATGIGAHAVASGVGATALGNNAKAYTDNSIAVGSGSQTNSGAGVSKIAIGGDAYAGTGGWTGAVALGGKARAEYDGLAIGYEAKATASGTVALGRGSTATEGNTVSVGNSSTKRRIVNVGDARLNSTSSDAVTGKQLYQLSTATNGLISQASAGSAVRVGAENTGTTLTVSNKNGETRYLNGVRNGVLSTTSTDAITGQQLHATNSNVSSAQAAADVAKATASSAQTTANTANTNAGTALAKANAVSGLVSQVSASGNVRLGGENTGTVLDARNKSNAVRSITGLRDGALSTSSTEAVTGKQLNATNSNVAAVKSTADAAQARLAVLDGLVGQVSASGNVRLGADNTGTVVDVANKSGAKRKLQNLANGVLSTSSTDAVTGQQLNATNSEVTSVRTAATAAKTVADAARGVADGAVLKADALGGLVGQVSASGNVRLGAENTGTIVDVANKSGGKRRIYNIANGTLSVSSTDAVTGQQLFATNALVETQRQDLAGHAQQLTDQEGRIADNRVELDALRTDFDNFDPDLDGVVKFSADRRLVDMEGARVSGVAAGNIGSATSTDAVNGGQLFAANEKIAALEVAGKFVSVGVGGDQKASSAGMGSVAIGDSAEATPDGEGGVALGAYARAIGKNSISIGRAAFVAQDAEGGFALGVGTSVNASQGMALGAESRVQAGAHNAVAIGYGSIASQPDTVSFGNDNVQRRLTGISRGTGEYDAAAIVQLAESLSALGGGAGLDSYGGVNNPIYNVQGGTQTNVGDALAALDGAVVRSDSRVDGLEGQLRATFQQSPSIRADGVSQLSLAGAKGMVLSNLADGRIAAGSRDAVTGSQLYAAEQKISQNRNDLEAMRKEREMGEQAMRGLDAGVIDYGGARLTGVAEAKLSADSSDVVRASQLFRTNEAVASLADRFNNVIVDHDDLSTPAEAAFLSVAVGGDTRALGEGSTSVGSYAASRGKQSTAIGYGAHIAADALTGVSLGQAAGVFADWGVALGSYSRVAVGARFAVAVGAQSIAESEMEASFGNVSLKRRLTNIANGTANHNAATIGQLRGALSALGGDIDANGNVITAGFTVQGQHQSTVNDALTTLDSAVVTTGSRMDRVETQLRSVFQESPSTRSDGTAQLTLAGANGMVISNVANGLIAAGSREAVNGGQLHAVQQQLNGRMDGLEQRVDGQPQSRALSTASAAPTEQVTPTPETSDSPQVASAGEGTSPTPQPKSKKDDTPSPTPQVDTAELEKMLARANEYTDGAISNFERRLDKMDKRFNRMAAMSSAQTAMAMNTAGLATYNRLGAGVGYAEGESAMAVGYQRVLNDKGSATFSLNGAFTNSGERSMGVGVGIGW
ncbi:hypothetical protein B9Y66_01715 [Stenotrophomonas maltophilia]|nr:hypothetical protein B9Y66_01715 [Stenotrophomonas maltophilia]